MRSETTLEALVAELSLLPGRKPRRPLTEPRVAALEALLGAPLPPEFHSFLLRVGMGHPSGPLLDLDWITEEIKLTKEDVAEDPSLIADSQGHFPISRTDVEQLRRLAAEGQRPLLTLNAPLPGTMPLRDHGCGWVSMLA